MLRELSHLCRTYTGNYLALFVFLLGTIIGNVYITSGILPLMYKEAGYPIVVPDLRYSGWNLDDIYLIFQELGPYGRDLYRWIYTSGLDAISPAFVIGLFMSLLSFLWDSDSVFSYTNLLPIVMYMADQLENMAIMILMSNYPLKNPFLEIVARIGGICTMVKFLLIFLQVAFVTLGIMYKFMKVIIAYKQKNH